MNPFTPCHRSKTVTFVGATFAGILSLAPLQAATIDQTGNGQSQAGWNDPVLWNSAAPTAGNDYRTVSGTSPAGADAITVNGMTWNYSGTVRTASNAGTQQTTDTAFAGDHLIVSTGTRLLGKNYSSTATANVVLDGGHINFAVDTVANNLSGTLAGTISFGSSTSLGAILMLGNTNYTLNVASAISGDASKTLQLSMSGGTTRANVMNITGDMSGFFGTIYVGVATAGTGPSSFFNIATSAVNASLVLDTTNENFRYSLLTNQSFGSVTVAGNNLAPGTYTFTQLDELAGGKFLDNGGTITVVPEPSVTILSAIGLLGMILMIRGRGQRRQEV